MNEALPKTGERKIRTRGPRTVERILSAANALFLDRGFGETTMEAIAQKAGVSKVTLYSHFGNREEMFAAVIRSTGSRLWSDILSLQAGSADLVRQLQRLAGGILDLLLSPAVVATNRMVGAEGGRMPGLGTLYYENGPGRLIDGLAVVFDSRMEAGLLRKTDSRDAAKHFVGLVLGDLQLRAMLGDEAALSAAERQRAIGTGVEAFVAAYAASGRSPAT